MRGLALRITLPLGVPEGKGKANAYVFVAAISNRRGIFSKLSLVT